MGLLRVFLVAVLLFATLNAKAVVGGVTASNEDIPGQVALVDLSRPLDESCVASGGTEYFCKQYCSGLLIHPQWVLTVAHCATDIAVTDISKLRVVAGTTRIDNASDDGAHVVSKIVHAGYRSSSDNVSNNANDIALLKLAAPLDVPLASLAEVEAEASLLDINNTEGGYPFLNDEVLVSGWGRLTSDGKFPVDLQRTRMDLQSDSYCLEKYSAVNYSVGTMLCAAEFDASSIEDDDVGDLTPRDEEGEAVCSFDSGGPLAILANGFLQVAGLTSFADASKCGQTDYPDAFTRVTSYLGWLESQATGGANFGDLAVSITGAGGAGPGATLPVTVTLKNQSVTTSLNGAGFTLLVPAGFNVTETSVPADVSCGPTAEGRSCTVSGALAAGAFRLVAFSVTPTDSEAVMDAALQAVANAAPRTDYRSGNDSDTHRILLSSAPDLALEMDGYVQEIVDADGVAWIIGRVVNRASHQLAPDVKLTVVLDAALHLEADSWEDLTCTGTTCLVGTLQPGEERHFRLRVLSSGAWDGDVQITASTTAGDFPAMVDGVSDTVATVPVAFNAVHEGGDGGGAPISGGGGADSALLVLVSLLGLRRFRQ